MSNMRAVMRRTYFTWVLGHASVYHEYPFEDSMKLFIYAQLCFLFKPLPAQVKGVLPLVEHLFPHDTRIREFFIVLFTSFVSLFMYFRMIVSRVYLFSAENLWLQRCWEFQESWKLVKVPCGIPILAQGHIGKWPFWQSTWSRKGSVEVGMWMARARCK